MAAGEQLGDLASEGTHVVEAGAALERTGHVQSAAAGRLHERDEPELVEQLAQELRTVSSGGELALRRIEVEDKQVGIVEPVAA